MKIFQAGLAGLSYAALSSLDEITSVVTTLKYSSLKSAHQEKIAVRFKDLQRRLTNSYNDCGADSGSTYTIEAGADAESTILDRLDQLQEWSKDNLKDCPRRKFKLSKKKMDAVKAEMAEIFDRSEAAESCNPTAEENALDKNKQWEDERGYWIGEYSFYGADGQPRFDQEYWNYPYDSYTGFIVGGVKGNRYAQRNVFLYPPQTAANCAVNNATQESTGECGVNGNHKEFFADQTANQCNYLNPGAIEGPFGGVFYSWTQLFGRKDDTVFYEVYRNPDGSGSVSQKQMTTIREVVKPDGTVELRRTRSAQGFLEDGSGTVST